MRVALLLALALLVVPWSGCVSPGGGPGSLAATASVVHRIFDFDGVDRAQDPVPAAGHSCPTLLAELNARALQQARVNLEQSVENGWGGHYWAFGGGDAVMFAETTSSPQVRLAAADAAGPMPPGSAADAQVTGTNNQEAAADEADIVKTDGEWTYVLSRGVLHILHSERVGDVAEVANVTFPGSWGGVLLLEPRGPGEADDRLVLVLPGASPAAARGIARLGAPAYLDSGMTRIVVLDLRDRAHPVVEEDIEVEGSSAGARLIDGTAYVVVQRWEGHLGLVTWVHPTEQDLARHGLSMDEYYRLPVRDSEGQVVRHDEDGKPVTLAPWTLTQQDIRRDAALRIDAANVRQVANLTLADHLPFILDRVGGTSFPRAIDDDACRRVHVTPETKGRGITTILSLDAAGDLATKTTQVMAGASIVYASADALVLAAASQDFWWFWVQPDLEEATDLQWFDLDGLDVTLRAAGRVPGIVQDSFGLDVHGGQLRVATTTGTWGRAWLDAAEVEPMLNHVAVFDAVGGQLVLKGIVGGIAPGERIWSARFTDERAYLVTFRQIDPLWVIDLVGEPEVLGELEIPGVSTYIHPIGDDRLLTVGMGASNEDGTGADSSRVQVSLFDVSDPTRPTRMDVLDLSPGHSGRGGGWAWSGAMHEHKAFTYWDAIGTLALPLTSSSYQDVWRGDHMESSYQSHVALKLVDVDADGGALSLRGEVDQDHLAVDNRHYGMEIQRSYFLGYPERDEVSVYSVSDAGVTAHDLATFGLQGSVAFPQPQDQYPMYHL